MWAEPPRYFAAAAPLYARALRITPAAMPKHASKAQHAQRARDRGVPLTCGCGTAARRRRQYDMERKLREFNEQGYVIFEQLLDHDVLDGIFPEFMKLYSRVRGRESTTKGAYVKAVHVYIAALAALAVVSHRYYIINSASTTSAATQVAGQPRPRWPPAGSCGPRHSCSCRTSSRRRALPASVASQYFLTRTDVT
jgi:hypothetical protein